MKNLLNNIYLDLDDYKTYTNYLVKDNTYYYIHLSIYLYVHLFSYTQSTYFKLNCNTV